MTVHRRNPIYSFFRNGKAQDSRSSGVNEENSKIQIEVRIEHEDTDELMQLEKEILLFEVKTLPHSLVSDVEDTRRKGLNTQMAESLATENIERKIDENDIRQVKTLNKSDPLNVEDNVFQGLCCEYESCDSIVLWKIIYSMRICA
ncbi:hypothetical protein AVEN_262479-1 [Araneus ventricosus]|uniref:Uncharacterized protein n=1 Tax=Araneus ventricosus TaxID=182803 RepID=A0A4Y2GAJ7_ARAVE|nr:hypothetical protein AVEN_262479-1 [Araneus ventricosus]